jgi:hypothetical protein
MPGNKKARPGYRSGFSGGADGAEFVGGGRRLNVGGTALV